MLTQSKAPCCLFHANSFNMSFCLQGRIYHLSICNIIQFEKLLFCWILKWHEKCNPFVASIEPNWRVHTPPPAMQDDWSKTQSKLRTEHGKEWRIAAAHILFSIERKERFQKEHVGMQRGPEYRSSHCLWHAPFLTEWLSMQGDYLARETTNIGTTVVEGRNTQHCWEMLTPQGYFFLLHKSQSKRLCHPPGLFINLLDAQRVPVKSLRERAVRHYT